MIIRPAVEADIDAMVDLLHTHMNSKFSMERWRRLFTYPWCREKPDYGRVAEIDGEIVGCVAAIYSDRMVNGRIERFVNPAAWYLKKEARGDRAGLGRGLMDELTSNPDQHYIINTSSKNTTNLLRRIGFKVLDDAKYVWRFREAEVDDEAIELITDRDAVFAAIPEHERRILSDHKDLAVKPIIVRTDGQSTLIVLAETIKGGGERWADVLYTGDPICLARHGRAVADRLHTFRDMILAADCRFCAGPPDGAERVPLEVARYAKSKSLTGHHLDHLYSEIQLLDQKLR